MEQPFYLYVIGLTLPSKIIPLGHHRINMLILYTMVGFFKYQKGFGILILGPKDSTVKEQLLKRQSWFHQNAYGTHSSGAPETT